MTNQLVGEVYLKIIEAVVEASTNDFEETGVGQGTLNELQQEWQLKLSQRQVASMPWEPKPPPVQQTPLPNTAQPSATSNGLPGNPYSGGYDSNSSMPANGSARVKAEPGTEQYVHGLPPMNSYSQIGASDGGMHRAQQLVQQQYGAQALQRNGNNGGLALPGQQPKPQGLQMPNQNQQQYAQAQYAQQQQQQALRQQQALQQQQQNPRIKVENNSPNVSQGQFQQQQPRQPNPAYGQTDGADEALEEWQAMIAQRRAVAAEETERANHMMREKIAALSDDLSSGLMMPLDEQRARLQSRKRKATKSARSVTVSSAGPSIAQLDGDVDDDDRREIVKNDEDEDAINSDLDDSDDENNGVDDPDDENVDSILCTYDKVQRVKNKWKCTLKDGVLHTGGKEWLFHKGNGEFEW